jgi:hypothetical protein
VREIEAQDAVPRTRSDQRRFALRAVLEDKRWRGQLEGSAEQAAEKTARGDVMPAITREMKSGGARLFGAIKQRGQFPIFRV